MIATHSARLLATMAAVLTLCGLLVGAAEPPGATVGAPLTQRGWMWPVLPVRILRGFEAPAHPYGPGHRGIDLAGTEVHAPAEGVVAFVGTVAGRGVLTIDHGGGLVSSYEPVVSDLAAGDHVARGQPLATISKGGHTAPGSLHLGVRLDGEYINPLRLLGGVPRAILLPCC